MTTPSPIEVYHEYAALIWNDDDGGFEELDVESIVPSMDVDRMTFCEAVVTVANVTNEQWAWIDPRQTGGATYTRQLHIQVKQFDMAGALLGQIPAQHLIPDEKAALWIRSATRDRITGRTTINVAGGESILNERRRNSAVSTDTGATTVSALIFWSLLDTFGTATLDSAPIVLSTALPAGDRRKMNPGETHIELIRPELDAINCRLYDVWGLVWSAQVRATSGTTIKLATYTQEEGAPSDADGIVSSLFETVSRDGDWADGVLIKYDNTDNGGTVNWAVSSSGNNTKSLYLTFNRAAPTGPVAQDMETRARARGLDYIIEARCRLDVLPGRPLEVHLRDEVLTGLTIRSVEWHPLEGTMNIRAQTGDPIS
jgi:hypothetical protein